MSLIKTLGTFEFAASGSGSTVISGSVYDRYSRLALYSPAVVVGTLNLEETPDLASPSWVVAQDITGTDITFTATRSRLIDCPVAGGLRISGSLQTSGSSTFTLVGLMAGNTRVLPDPSDSITRI